MKVLYLYRHAVQGYSITKVFKPIERTMQQWAEVSALEMPARGAKPLDLLRNICAVRSYLRRHAIDIVHITGAEHYLIPFLWGHKVIVTVHDLGFYTNHVKTLKLWLRLWLWIKPLRRATRVTFTSTKTERETLMLVHVPPEKQRVIPNPVDDRLSYCPKDISADHPRILHIGTAPNKNLLRVIEALKAFPCHLRVIGRLNKELQEALISSCICYSVATDLSDEQIKTEYEDCDIVSFPSLYEGFGMPIIEAQAVGRPVVTSSYAPMSDVAGAAAILVDPTDVRSIAEGFRLALARASELVRLGQINVARFRLPEATKRYYELYREVLQ